MIDPVQQSLSALSAFRKSLDVTADNIANVNTDGFKKSRVTFSEQTPGGVSAQVQQINTPGIPKETIQGDKLVDVESSNVDLADELTEMIPTQTAYTANLKTVSSSDEMIGALMDILG